MQIDDLKQLCEACKRSKNPKHDLDLIKTFYKGIEENCLEEDQQTIMDNLKKNNFDLNIVQVLNKEFFESDTDMDFINKLFAYPELIEYITPILLNSDIYVEMKFELLDASQNICIKIKDHCKPLDENQKKEYISFLEERRDSISDDYAIFDRLTDENLDYFKMCQDIYEKAVDTFKILDSNQILMITDFLASQNVLVYRDLTEMKAMGDYFVEQGLNRTVYNYLTDDDLTGQLSWKSQKEFLQTSEKCNHNEKLYDLFHNLNKNALKERPSLYLAVLKEVIASNFNEKAISLVNETCYESFPTFIPSFEEFILSIQETYGDEVRFERQLESINDVDSFLGYLGELGKEKGNCDIKPKTMVKKFNAEKIEK